MPYAPESFSTTPMDSFSGYFFALPAIGYFLAYSFSLISPSGRARAWRFNLTALGILAAAICLGLALLSSATEWALAGLAGAGLLIPTVTGCAICTLYSKNNGTPALSDTELGISPDYSG